MGWRCFIAEPSAYFQRSLRRYGANHAACPAMVPGALSYHDASVVIDERLTGEGVVEGGSPKDAYAGDPRWPKACACGHVFHPEEEWQVNVDRLYSGSPDGVLRRLRDLPPGAIWRAEWLEAFPGDRLSGPDGKVWALMLPGGVEWMIYGFSSDDPPQKWQVEGELPNITVTPSINQEGLYHGLVKAGIISEDLDGRVFPKWPPTA